jgi:hypothetical protein
VSCGNREFFCRYYYSNGIPGDANSLYYKEFWRMVDSSKNEDVYLSQEEGSPNNVDGQYCYVFVDFMNLLHGFRNKYDTVNNNWFYL